VVIAVRPRQGGFLRPFGCGRFIREFLLGRGPEGSPVIDPDRGSTMTDIHHFYKEALARAFARDAVERLEERQIKEGKPALTEEEYRGYLEYFLERIPLKLTRMRYASFTKYFSHLLRLGWVEKTGETETSTLQKPAPGVINPEGRPRVFYRLTRKGIDAADYEWSNPQLVLYPERPLAYFRAKNKQHKYYRRPKKVPS